MKTRLTRQLIETINIELDRREVGDLLYLCKEDHGLKSINIFCEKLRESIKKNYDQQ